MFDNTKYHTKNINKFLYINLKSKYIKTTVFMKIINYYMHTPNVKNTRIQHNIGTLLKEN